MTKPMLIEALKPGMRAKLGNGAEVWRTESYIRSKTITKISNVAYLTSTDYEIIPDEPKPWEPSPDDRGWSLSAANEPFQMEDKHFRHGYSFRTQQAAEHKAKLDRIFAAILNMPGYGGGVHCVYWHGGIDKFSTYESDNITQEFRSGMVMEFAFETIDQAINAAKYANNLIMSL